MRGSVWTTGFRRISAAIAVGNPGLSKTTYPSVLPHRGNFILSGRTGCKSRRSYRSAWCNSSIRLNARERTEKSVYFPRQHRGVEYPIKQGLAATEKQSENERVICTQGCITLTPRCRFPVERKRVGRVSFKLMQSSQTPEPRHSLKPDMRSDDISAKCQPHLILLVLPHVLTPSRRYTKLVTTAPSNTRQGMRGHPCLPCDPTIHRITARYTPRARSAEQVPSRISLRTLLNPQRLTKDCRYAV